MLTRLMTILALMVFACGCGTKAARTTEVAYPPKAKDAPVEVFINRAPERAHTVIGFARRKHDDESEEMIRWAKVRTRETGGDAVILHTARGGYRDSGIVRENDGTFAEAEILRWADTPAPTVYAGIVKPASAPEGAEFSLDELMNSHGVSVVAEADAPAFTGPLLMPTWTVEDGYATDKVALTLADYRTRAIVAEGWETGATRERAMRNATAKASAYLMKPGGR